MPLETIPDRLKSDHLFLLVGGNPLPNAVAGKLLLREGGTIVLVHSNDTAAVAGRLAAWLEMQGVQHISYAPVPEADALKIRNGVREKMPGDSQKSVGLHYTGGTKAMAVHAYRAVADWAKEQKSTPVYSYLDARTLRLCFDNGISRYVGNSVSVKLAQLLTLHNWELGQALTHNPMPETTQAIMNHWQAFNFVKPDNFNQSAFGKWQQHVNSRCILNRKPKSEEELQKTELKMPDADILAALNESLCKDLGLEPTVRVFPLAKGKEVGFQQLRSFAQFFDSGWFEFHVLNTLEQIKENLGLTAIFANVVASHKEAKSSQQTELDVVVIRGYQLFLFSCSVANPEAAGNRSLLKHKLFEAYIRAKQLGGDEACAALVCFADDPGDLEEEIKLSIGTSSGQIKVFGKNYLSCLSAEITGWMKKQIGKEG
ncbi:MAG: hypothetical protein KC418_21915 [Anaerolineales bacterium]|nr:hypothetical protein [Anaerolineales bacterium]